MIHRYIIEATDEVKGFEEAIEKLDREWGIEKLEPCNDCISRQAVFDALESIGSLDTEADREYAKSVFEALPPITPQQEPCSNCCNGNQIEKAKLCQKSYLAGMEHKQEPKTGHWIDIMVGDMPAQVCDQCKTFYPLSYTGGGHNYCPSCGSRMVEPQESEE